MLKWKLVFQLLFARVYVNLLEGIIIMIMLTRTIILTNMTRMMSMIRMIRLIITETNGIYHTTCMYIYIY